MGSAGTIAAGDRIKQVWPEARVVGLEPTQCPTLYNNGYGAHDIQGIGDKHATWIHHVTEMDAIACLDDIECKKGLQMLTEEAGFNPITPYGESKIRAEQEIRPLADDRFSPVFLRNATAYGVSPRLRGDIVVNNLVGYAFTQGDVLIQSDGTPWRPLVHVEDICRAFLAVLQAPRDVIHNQAFNVGRNDDNLRVREIADLVKAVVPGCSVRYAEGGGPDPRSYRVDCGKIARTLPAFRPHWTVARVVRELYEAYRAADLTSEQFHARYFRLRQIRKLQDEGRLGEDLRWRRTAPAVARA
jgi:dTDP-D-glucose 4,6-dehydratase